MIRLSSRNLSAATLTYLRGKQSVVDAQMTFTQKSLRATLSWDGKSSSAAGALHFGLIRTKLIAMCIAIEICVYCENNEATDIEHVFPKKLYPSKTFVWGNYVLACSKCNTRHKSDKFKIFIPATSVTAVDITLPRGTYIKPKNQAALFINPRVEEPMNFMQLDLASDQFLFTEIAAPGTRDYQRAAYTIELLGLNSRGALIAARRSALKFYINRLETYVRVNNSTSFGEIQLIFNNDFDPVDTTLPFISEKQRLMDTLKQDILDYPHTTVWKELIRQRAALPKTNALIGQLPIILSW